MLFQKKQTPYQTNQQSGGADKKKTLIGLSVATVLIIIITTVLSSSNKGVLTEEENKKLYYKFENSQFSLSIPKNFVATSNLARIITFEPRSQTSKNNPTDTKDLPKTGKFTVAKYIKSFVAGEPTVDRIKRFNFYDLEGGEINGLEFEEKQINQDKAVLIKSDTSIAIFIIKSDYVWKLEFTDSTEDSVLLAISETITASLGVKTE